MLKSQLVEAVAGRASSLTSRDVEEVVNAVFDEIADALASDKRVELRGFGTFSARERGERQARNPRTGSTVKVPAKKVPHFKPGKQLRDRLNG